MNRTILIAFLACMAALNTAGAEEAVVDATIEIVPAGEFWTSLSPEERTSVGFDKLTPEERIALDALATKEIRLAQQGDVTGFAGTFIARRTDEERRQAGLARLSVAEKYQMDRLIARALANRPVQMSTVAVRAPGENDIKTKRTTWETHGFVQLEYGWGSGDREYKAGTIGVSQVNPKTGSSVSFIYSVVEGDGWWCPPPYRFGWHSGPFARWRY
jgi:hypothetical protein